MESKALLIRLAEYYKDPNQSLLEFKNEVSKLTDKDKQDFTRWFNEAGLPVK